MDEHPPLALLLRRHRQRLGLSQEQFAEKARLSWRTVSDLERGTNLTPRKDTLLLLLEALDLPPDQRAAFETAARRPADAPETSPAPLPAPTRPARPDPPLVGRSPELALLHRLLDPALPTPPLLALAGEPGIGKSSLLREAARLAAPAGWSVLAGGCQRRGGQEPYAPLLGALAAHSQRLLPAQARHALDGCAWLVKLLPELAVGPIDPLPAWSLPPEQERRLMFAAVARYLQQVAGPAGTLLILDDLQWADADALDLLRSLLHPDAPVLLRVLTAYRDTELQTQAPLGLLLADLAHTELAAHRHLAPLAPDDAAALLAGLVPPPLRASPAAQDALQRTGGVPFYLVSYAQELRLLQPGQSPAADIPWSVAQSIRARVAALPPPTQEVLGLAAVVGRVVPRTLLTALAAPLHLEVLAALDAAGEARLLVEEGPYAHQFAHDVVREVVEADLGAARRALLHRAIAEALEATAGGLAVEQLAYHYARSDQPERALPYLAAAAEQARAAAAHQEEAALLAQALELARRLGRDDLRGDLHARRGRALSHLTLIAEARKEMEAALAFLRPQDEERRAEILIDMALASHWISDADNTRRCASEAHTLAEHLGREDLAIAALGALVYADSSDGEHRVGLDRYRQLAMRAANRYPAAVAPGMEMAGGMLYWLADFDNAINYSQEAIVLSRAVHDSSTLIRALGDLGCSLTGSGRYAEALQMFTEAQQLSREQGAVRWLARSTSMRGGLHLELFDFQVAEALAEEAREISRSVNWMNALASSGIDLLLNFTRRGEVGRTELLLGEVAEWVAQGQGAHGWLWKLRFVQAQAEIAHACGDLAAALHFADQSLARSRRHGRVKYEVAALLVRAQVQEQLGRTREALEHLQFAVQRARGTGDPAMFVRAAAALLTVDGTDALSDEARAAVDRITAALPDEPMQRRFLEAEPVRAILRFSRT